MSAKTIAIIPARYASTRFPGKPLALIDGKQMIQRVYEAVKTASFDEVVVATDDKRIQECVLGFNGKVMMTSPHHPSGTDRCGEAASQLHLRPEDVIINIQGDEPSIQKDIMEILIRQFNNNTIDIATLITPITDKAEIEDPNKVKVIFDKNFKAIYFSRFAVPFARNNDKSTIRFYKHIGIYGYRYKTLCKLIQLHESALEKAEKLEQLRWIENGYSIYVSECHYEGIGIDTPDDLLKWSMNNH